MSSSPAELFSIRPATNQDAERIRALVFSVLEEFGLTPDSSGTDADLSDIEASYLAPGGMFEVAEEADGALVGTVGFVSLDDETCELRKMYLLPRARGCGLGKLLLARAIEQARAAGFKRMVLETASALTGAKRLYVSNGFVPVESDRLSPRCNQAYALDL
ncbi:MAG: GNAT family N-acetyltransferase [Blastocatellia bacterium]